MPDEQVPIEASGTSDAGDLEAEAKVSVTRRRTGLSAVLRRPVALVITVSLLIVAVLTATGVTLAYNHLNGIVGDGGFTPAAPEGYEAPKKKRFDDAEYQPLNILVMGDDSRSCSGCAIDEESGGGSDTTILLHLSRDRENAYAVSIPRDLMTDRPACVGKAGEDSTIPAETYVQWNAAYSVGGPSCTILQIQEISHVAIDNSLVVNFQGFKDMVDAVGGVEVCIPEEIDDQEHGIKLEPGTRTISGDEALSYVRVREGVGDGSDLSRIKRQQAFVAAMVKSVLSARTLSSPVKVYRFLNAAASNLEFDDTIANLRDLASLGAGFSGIGLDKIKFFTIPIAADPQNPDNRVVLAPESEQVFKRLKKDKTIPGKFLETAIKVDKVPGQVKREPKEEDQAAVDAQNQDLSYNGLCTI